MKITRVEYRVIPIYNEIEVSEEQLQKILQKGEENDTVDEIDILDFQFKEENNYYYNYQGEREEISSPYDCMYLGAAYYRDNPDFDFTNKMKQTVADIRANYIQEDWEDYRNNYPGDDIGGSMENPKHIMREIIRDEKIKKILK